MLLLEYILSRWHFVLMWLQFSLLRSMQRIFVVNDSSCAAQSAFLSRLHEGLPCRENRVSRKGFFYPCRHERDCRMMLDENKNGKSVERRRRERWKEEWNVCRVKQGIQWKISVMFTGGKYCWWQKRNTSACLVMNINVLISVSNSYMMERQKT